MNQFRKTTFLFFLIIVFCMAGCKTYQLSMDDENSRFLAGENAEGEVFRVLLSSDEYRLAQLKYSNYISRADDISGDRYIMEELKQYDIINEARIGELKVWLFPDSGKIMKVRPEKITFLQEIDQLLLEDIQRWSFKFHRRVIEPQVFTVRYRVVLRKKKSDDEIIKDVQKQMLE